MMLVRVGVHRCDACRRHFRAQPPFLRPDSIYTRRVVDAAVQAVFADGMAYVRVPERLARDFHVRPSEASIRRWCRAYATGRTLDSDYTPWVVRSFSGVLCVDEVDQNRVALLLAVDPKAPEGDRLVGYQLLRDSVEQPDVEAFLTRLREAGITPQQVVTDGSALYPTVLAKVWPQAAHQLCLFHETKSMLRSIIKVVDRVRRALPEAPAAPRGAGALRRQHDRAGPHPSDRDARLALVQHLRREGPTIRAIAQQTGHSRNTFRSWLRGVVVPLTVRDGDALPVTRLRDATRSTPPPPEGWRSWAHVAEIKQELRASRYLLLARCAGLTVKETKRLATVLDAPCAHALRVTHRFVQTWYAIWHDDEEDRRSVEEARTRYRALRDDVEARTIDVVARVQRRMTDERMEKLSTFLRDPEWEATSHGAERMARTFRHLQATRFRLRSRASIEAHLDVHASARRRAVETLDKPKVGRSTRGRPTKAARQTLRLAA